MKRALGVALGALPLIACAARPVPPPVVSPRPPPALRVVPGQISASTLFGDVPARASRLGAGPLAVVVSGEAVEGERMGGFVELPADTCVLAYGRASSSIDDLDLAAFDDDGNPLAVDQGKDPKPTLLLCPPQPARVYLGAFVVTGMGWVGVGVQSLPKERAEEIAGAFGAHGALGEGGRTADAWRGLDDHARAHRQALGGEWEEFYTRALAIDSRAPAAVNLPVEADQCVDAVIVPGDEVQLLEVEAVDDAGRVVARAREGGNDRTLTVCSPIPFNGSLLVRPHVGRGLAAVVLARTRASTARDLTAKPEVLWEAASAPLASAVTERSDLLGREGYGPARSTTNGTLTLGHRASLRLDPSGPPGSCTRLDVVAGAPLSLLDARAWADDGALLAADEGAWSATLFTCGHGKGHVDLETRGRPGPFALMARPERWHDPVFAAHPLAAGRMMTRASDGGTRILPGVPISARALSLDADHLVAWTETVPPSGCLYVSAGAEGDGGGLELRAFDAATGEELDRSHAQHAVGVRACGPASVVPVVRFELRATSGKLDVVVGERVK